MPELAQYLACGDKCQEAKARHPDLKGAVGGGAEHLKNQVFCEPPPPGIPELSGLGPRKLGHPPYSLRSHERTPADALRRLRASFREMAARQVLLGPGWGAC